MYKANISLHLPLLKAYMLYFHENVDYATLFVPHDFNYEVLHCFTAV